MDAALFSLTDELVRTQDQLHALADLSQTIRYDSTLASAAMATLTCTSRLIPAAELGLLLQIPGQSPLFETQSASAETRLTPSQLTQWLSKTTSHKRHWSATDQPPFTSILVVPVTLFETIQGILVLVDYPNRPFESTERILAETIASQAGHGFENIVYQAERLAQVQRQTELNLARDVQIRLLPDQPPSCAGLDLWATSYPARSVGGDLYNYQLLPDGRLAFAFGDVSGKGFPAAMIMAMLQAIIRSSLRYGKWQQPNDLLQMINAAIYEELERVEMFVTLLVGCYDPIGRVVTMANAGHSPVLAAVNGKSHFLNADVPPIGVIEELDAMVVSLPLQPGDTLAILSDGIPEAENHDGEFLSYDALLPILNEWKNCTADQIGNRFLNAARQFSDGQLQSDDQTIMILKGVE